MSFGVLAGANITYQALISKPGKLSRAEFEKMKIHPVVGAEILERVRSGEMTPKAAERWGKENDETFSKEPDPTSFDPMKEESWTLQMTAAWIIERTVDRWRADDSPASVAPIRFARRPALA